MAELNDSPNWEGFAEAMCSYVLSSPGKSVEFVTAIEFHRELLLKLLLRQEYSAAEDVVTEHIAPRLAILCPINYQELCSLSLLQCPKSKVLSMTKCFKKLVACGVVNRNTLKLVIEDTREERGTWSKLELILLRLTQEK